MLKKICCMGIGVGTGLVAGKIINNKKVNLILGVASFTLGSAIIASVYIKVPQ